MSDLDRNSSLSSDWGVLARFIAKFTPDPVTGCWVWHASKDSGGYGQMRIGGKASGGYLQQSSRIAHRLFIGAIPDGLHIDHVVAWGCTTVACVNPEHLQAVPRDENVRRGKRGKRVGNGQYQRDKTHCPSGHEYNEANTHVRANGHRQCRVCARDAQREKRHYQKYRAEAKRKAEVAK